MCIYIYNIYKHYIWYTSVAYIYTLYHIYTSFPMSHILFHIYIYVYIYLGKEIQPVHPKGNQSWIFIRRTDAEVETPILWPPDMKSWLIWKDPDAGKDWRQEEKGTAEDEMVGWHHRCDGHELEQAPGVGDGQGGLVCCSPWGRKESDTTEWLKWTELNWFILYIPHFQKDVWGEGLTHVFQPSNVYPAVSFWPSQPEGCSLWENLRAEEPMVFEQIAKPGVTALLLLL